LIVELAITVELLEPIGFGVKVATSGAAPRRGTLVLALSQVGKFVIERGQVLVPVFNDKEVGTPIVRSRPFGPPKVKTLLVALKLALVRFN
jgi:hypothetical protein